MLPFVLLESLLVEVRVHFVLLLLQGFVFFVLFLEIIVHLVVSLALESLLQS